VTPFVQGNVDETRHRETLEIDTLAKRTSGAVRVGAVVRLTDKISTDFSVQRSATAYEPNSLYLNTDLGRILNHKSTLEQLAIRFKVTPYTTVGVDGEAQQDRFDVTTTSNSNYFRIGPVVEFNPQAIVGGRAGINFLKQVNLSGSIPDFNGTSTFVDLNYTWRESTRFSVNGRRDLEYSYILAAHQFLVTQFTGAITQHLGTSWEVGGYAGRARLHYGQAAPDETLLTGGADITYTMRHTRVGLHADRNHRTADVATLFRGYDRFRIGPTITYLF